MTPLGTQLFFSFHVTVPKIDGDSFNGPLEVLWTLIKSYQVDIFLVSLETITKDFLSYTKTHHSSLNEISEFTLVGTQLLFYKSKLLLPEIYSDDESLTDPHRLPKELIERLLEYKQIQLVLQQIRILEENSRAELTRKSSNSFYNSENTFVQLNLKDFIQSFKSFLHQKEETSVLEINKEKINFISVKNDFIEYIKTKKKVSFLEYISDMSLLKVINVFLALLEIIRNNTQISVLQHKNNKDIYIYNKILSSS